MAEPVQREHRAGPVAATTHGDGQARTLVHVPLQHHPRTVDALNGARSYPRPLALLVAL